MYDGFHTLQNTRSTWQRLFTNSYNSTFYYVAGLIIESLTAMFWWQIKSDLFLLWRLSIVRPFYLDGDCTYIYKLRFLTLIVKQFTRKYHQCWCILFSLNPWIYQLSTMFLIFWYIKNLEWFEIIHMVELLINIH